MQLKSLLLILALTLVLAGNAPTGCDGTSVYDGNFSNVTSYSVTPKQFTPEGIAVDASGFQVDLADIDARVDKVEQCLKSMYPTGTLPDSIVQNGHCLANKFDTDIHRESLKVKIAPDWHLGCLGEQQFACGVDPQYCLAKGVTPTPDCPCECRGAIQDNSTIVTTPDLHLFDNDLMRIVTTCNFIWIPGLQECYSP